MLRKISYAQENIDNKEHCNTENLSISLNVSESILMNIYQNVTKKLKFTDYNSTLTCVKQIKIILKIMHITRTM